MFLAFASIMDMFEFWHQNQRLGTSEFGNEIQTYVQKEYVSINQGLLEF